MHVLPGAGEAPTTGSPIPSDFESIVEAAANGEASAAERALLEAHPVEWRETLEDLLDDTEASLESVRAIKGPERAQVVADFEEEKVRLVLALAALTGTEPGSDAALAIEVPGDVRLQSSWADGRVVVWAGGPGTNPATAEELSELLDRAGAPPASSWVKHGPVTVPTGNGAPTLAIPVGDALGWLVAAGADAGQGTDLLGSSIRWLGRVAVWGVRLVAQGSIVPTLRAHSRRENGPSSYSVRWAPALVDRDELRTVAAAMPGTVGAVNPSVEGRVVALAVLGAVVDAIATKAAAQLDFAAPPPDPRNLSSTAEAFLTRLDGTRFEAPNHGGHRAGRPPRALGQPATDAGPPAASSCSSTRPTRATPGTCRCWRPDPDGRLVPVERAIVDAGPSAAARGRARAPRADAARAAASRRQASRRGHPQPGRGVGADDRSPARGSRPPASTCGSRRCRAASPPPSLRVFAEPVATSVGRREPARRRALVGGVRRRRAHRGRHRPARQGSAAAHPLAAVAGSRSTRPTCNAAAAALAERGDTTQLTGAEMLRLALGLEGSPLAGGISRRRRRLGRRPARRRGRRVAAEPVGAPDGLRRRAPQLPGRGAGVARLPRRGRARRLPRARHGPRQDADDARPPARRRRQRARAGRSRRPRSSATGRPRRALHARAARRRAPRRRPRRRPTRSPPRSPTPTSSSPPTAPRCATSTRIAEGRRGTASCSTRRRRSRTRPTRRRSSCAASGARTPGRAHRHADRERPRRPVGDPRLHQPRPRRHRGRSSSPSCRATATAPRRAAEDALRALNGILVFRRTKAEPAIAAELPDRSTSSTTAR